ncbi:MAG: sigma 54-interacting transcriptional regulator [Bradymonadales bacterium]|nr:sigma 54-interacting transcriptional regulator [Bradymonadales bacterium]
MPSLYYRPAGALEFKTYQLHRKVTSIGKGDENDLTIADEELQDTHALVQFDGRTFSIFQVNRKCKISVNGHQVKKMVLSHRDEIHMGQTRLHFYLYDEPRDAQQDISPEALACYRKIHEFSAQLLSSYELTDLLERLMDSIIALTQADKGFLILTEGNELSVKVARNLQKENISDALLQVSDSIINKVLKSKQAVIVSDALNDEEFNTSLSVVNLKLCSVMCAPLLDRGEMLGLIYVGNDNVVNLFTESHLEMLTIFAAQASLIVANAVLLNQLKGETVSLRGKIDAMRYGNIVGTSQVMRQVFRTVEKVAPTDVSVLIQGETGTGKELIAREIHNRSPRHRGPFVTINSAAIPENLLESELFGHVRGAFTGAVSTRTGRFQAANSGTLFLDEIGEMPLNLQVKLLRALQERMVTKVGDNRAEPVDIRVIAASNKDLEEAIRKGHFREDLYYRLNVVTLFLPPLRERGDDVVLIAKYLVDKFCRDFDVPHRRLGTNALIAIKKYGWPGNIRELENRLKKAVIMAEKSVISPEDLDLRPDILPPIQPLVEARDEWQKNYINEVLALNNGNRTKTARDLGVDPRTIFRHLEKEQESED